MILRYLWYRLHTFYIDDSNSKAKALLEYLRTLEFVKEGQSDWGEEVSKELESGILRGLKDEAEGNVIPHGKIMSELHREFPDLEL